MSWKINREIVVVLGWPAAILMQLAHPLVLAGVLDHSVFVADPRRRWERLRSTVESMLLLTFGTEEEIRRTAAKINAIHDYVHGRLGQPAGRYSKGTPYSAHDPELLRWVHATLLDVIPRTYELLIGPLSEQEKDDYCAEAAALGPLLGMPRTLLPTNVRELRSYLAEVLDSGAICVTDRARWMAGELMALPPPLPSTRLLSWVNALPTLALLPDWCRSAYGFRWSSFDRACAGAAVTALGQVARRLPPLMRHWPASRSANE